MSLPEYYIGRPLSAELAGLLLAFIIGTAATYAKEKLWTWLQHRRRKTQAEQDAENTQKGERKCGR